MKGSVLVDAGIVDQHVEPAPGRKGLLHHALAGTFGADVFVVRDGLAARRQDLVDDAVRAAPPCRIDFAPPVVDDDAQAVRRQPAGVSPAEPDARSGDDRDARTRTAFVLDHCHVFLSVLLRKSWGMMPDHAGETTP